jgi:hypothetical protein
MKQRAYFIGEKKKINKTDCHPFPLQQTRTTHNALNVPPNLTAKAKRREV